MGRSKKKQQQHQENTPKVYSNERNVLRKRRELLSSTSRRPSASSKLNAVMQMDPPGNRRRMARNPVAEQHLQQDSLSPIPADADSSNDAASSGGGGPSECRRSSRKKTIKFDVRDLLNKTRKSHKIQIEARIDSNAPTNKVGGTGAASSKAELDSKQKNFFEKSAIFRRYSISENKLPPRPPPPPGALIHTIQQCVGELEQLPLAESGELNLAAISPIARRLSRTQDILTASMIKPKQVSSLIVTKLESASTSKAAVAVESAPMPTKRRVAERCEASTSTAATNKQPRILQKRGRKPKVKASVESPAMKAESFSISTCSSPSSSIDGIFQITAADVNSAQIPETNGNDPIEMTNNRDHIDSTTTGIDLNENLDASAVTLPLPKIPRDDCARNSTDESIAPTEEDTFSIQNLSSDESIASSSKGIKTSDEISLFGRSNSTDTASSDGSEKRRRKIRIAVKRVSLTPNKSSSPQFLPSPLMSPNYPQSPQSPSQLQQSPFGSVPDELSKDAGPTIEVLSSTNDEASNDQATSSIHAPKSKNKILKQLKGNKSEVPDIELSSSAPAVIQLDSETVESSVLKTQSLNDVESSTEKSLVATRRGRSKVNKEQLVPKLNATSEGPTAQENLQSKTNKRSSSLRRQILQLPTEKLSASESPIKTPEDSAQSMDDEPPTSNDDIASIQNQKLTSPYRFKESKQHDSDDLITPAVPPKTRSLRSTQSNMPQLTLPTKQRKNNKLNSQAIESAMATESNPMAQDSPEKDVPINTAQIENTEKQSPRAEVREEAITSEKTTPSWASKKKDDLELTTENQIGSPKYPQVNSVDENESETSQPEADGSSTDETTKSERRESPRLRSLPNALNATVTSSTPDSGSSAESSDGREKSSKTKTLNKIKPIMGSDKVNEETNSMCSDSSSITSSTSSSSSASSVSSSSKLSVSVSAPSKPSAASNSSSSASASHSSSSSSSNSSEERSNHSSKESEPTQQSPVEAKKTLSKSTNIDKIKSASKSDSECSEKSSTTDDMRFKKLEKHSKKRKTTRLERLKRWSSEGSESSCSTVSRTRSGTSEVKVKNDIEETNLQNDTDKTSTNDCVHETPSVVVENSNHSTSHSRSKSKKRTRRFVPIKYSSSESGLLSDDGQNPPPVVSNRLTRTRRKTISSASDFEELPAINLSPPDLALEYLPRRSRQGMSKSQADLSKISTDEESVKIAMKKRVRSRSKKGIRNVSKGRNQSTIEPTNDFSPKNKKTYQDEYPDPSSPTSSVSSYVASSTEEVNAKVLRQRKITRQSLKNQTSENSESHSKNENSDSLLDSGSQIMPTLVPNCLEETKDDENESHLKSQDDDNEVKTDASSTLLKDPEADKSVSPMQKKGAKSSVKTNNEKPDDKQIDKTQDIHVEQEKNDASQCEPSKVNANEPPPDFRRITRLSPKNSVAAAIESKSEEHPKRSESPKEKPDEPAISKKVTRASLKKIEILVSSDSEKKAESEEKDPVALPDPSDEQTKISPKARKPGKVSLKGSDVAEQNDLEVSASGLRSKAKRSTRKQEEEESKNLDDEVAAVEVTLEKTTETLLASVAQETVAQETVPQETVPQETVAQEAVAKEAIVQEAVAQEAVAQEAVAQEAVAQEEVAQEAVALETVAQETVAEEKLAQEPITNSLTEETPKKKKQTTRPAPAPKIPSKQQTDDKKEEQIEVGKNSDDLNPPSATPTQETEQLVKTPKSLRKTSRFSPRITEPQHTPQDELKLDNLNVESKVEFKEKSNVPLKESIQHEEPEKITVGRKLIRSPPDAVIADDLQTERSPPDAVFAHDLQTEPDQIKVPDGGEIVQPTEAVEAQQAVKVTRARKGTRFLPQVSQTSKNDISTNEKDNSEKIPEHENNSIPESTNSSSLPQQLEPENSNDINSVPKEHSVVPQEKSSEQPSAASNSTAPSKKQDYAASKKVLKQQLQSMLDSLTLVGNKATPPKESTPRRKKKSAVVSPATEVTPIPKKTDNSNDDQVMKLASSDSNQSDETMKQILEPTQKVDQKPLTPRRKLDSSFIESLEKSLLRSAKKASKKKEKDKAAIAQIASPKEECTNQSTSTMTVTATKKAMDQCVELKKPTETPSPKLKKKQPKESPKLNKKLASPIDDQNPTKRKNLDKTKKTEESSFANIFKNAPMATANSHPQPPKTKAETKFFSPGKSSIEYEPESPPRANLQPQLHDASPQRTVEVVKEKSPDLIPDPLKDIEKFIEDGVNLLKRTYKIDADDDGSLDRDILKPDGIITPKKCKLDENVAETSTPTPTPTPTTTAPPSQCTSPPDDDNSNSNSESSNLTSLTNTSTSEIDTPNGIRRSHRIKNNSKSTKCLVGRGLVRERERFSTKDDEKTIYSIDDQKMDLAEVEAKNSKFLKDMEERLSNFRVIRENEYKCERVISKEAKRMMCDCFLTPEEEERGELGCGEDCLNRLLMIECGTDCTVRDRCTNRRFNKFLYSPCRVFRTEKKGFGIMADIEILPGEFIMEYVGEVINGDEFEIRINDYSKDKNKHYYFMALRSDAVIDATGKGNISRFINHSCDPNAETQKWTVNGELRIGFFSRKSIMPGEEITFDYQYQRYGKEAQRCYCESSNCRGWIGAEPSSEEEEEEVDEEDESEETEEEESTEAVAPVLAVVPSPIPPVAGADQVKELLAPALVAGEEIPAIAAAETTKPMQSIAVTTPTAAMPEPSTPILPDVSKPTTLVAKKTKKEKKVRLHEEKLKRREPKQFLEDPDIEDEVRFLVKCGLRNQADTLRLSRLIVRAKLLGTRIKLLQILRQGELPCRRLFLDYHGLRLLHGWMSEVIDTRNTEENMEIRMELLSVLECLPIPNKTMLNDSKVYQTVRDWSNNKESHSPSDRSPTSVSPVQAAATAVPQVEDSSLELQKLAAKLVHTWDNLPEVFRIPKRERIEQMKEHEREADRQYKDVERDSSSRNRNRERFVSKSTVKKGRFQWSKEKERDNRINDRRKFGQNSGNTAKDGADKLVSTLAGGESHLSKEQRREMFAAKVARDEAEKRLAEERREFDIKCRFFGLDPKRVRPENMPFCVNPSTGQWYSTDQKPIPTPPSYAHVQVPVKPKSTNPEDYRLPPMDLPPLWKFAISPKGKIYYYHVKIRIPQWEPPIKILPLSGQHDAGSIKNSESDSSNSGPIESSEDDIEVIKGLDPVKLQAYIEKRIENRRLQRYGRLVEEKPISPRKEEDRIYNQMEVRKYKENKEKIRKRKEEIRKRRDIVGIPQATTPAVGAAAESSGSTNVAETTDKDGGISTEALPIQDYLLSSEEEELLKAECNNSPLIDKIVQGDKIVDELDALHRKRSMKRALPIREKYEHKKRKLEKIKESSKSTKRSKDGESSSSSSSSKYRKVREKFRCEIAGIIVQHLKPYRSETCFTGRILTDDDFNHLARKLTHFVMVKELKYCESIGQTLIVTESVKNKSREFIKKYMAKYGKVYVRPKNDPEFKDIPFL